jgi:primosomal protein N' (replication factor Y)
VAEGGYAAALLLDGWALLNRPDLRAGEEALRRWLNAATLVRPGGRVVVLADSGLRAVQALVRWDPITFAERELADREALGFPPAVRMASVSGPRQAVEDVLALAELPASANVFGPTAEEGDTVRALLRVPLPDAAALAGALHGALGVRSAKKASGSVRVRLDPASIG